MTALTRRFCAFESAPGPGAVARSEIRVHIGPDRTEKHRLRIRSPRGPLGDAVLDRRLDLLPVIGGQVEIAARQGFVHSSVPFTDLPHGLVEAAQLPLNQPEPLRIIRGA